jgi:hypothetical protein
MFIVSIQSLADREKSVLKNKLISVDTSVFDLKKKLTAVYPRVSRATFLRLIQEISSMMKAIAYPDEQQFKNAPTVLFKTGVIPETESTPVEPEEPEVVLPNTCRDGAAKANVFKRDREDDDDDDFMEQPLTKKRMFNEVIDVTTP